MKTLKIIVLVITTIGLLTGVSEVKENRISTEPSNHEINSPNVKLTVYLDIVKKGRPDGSNG